MKYRVVEKGMDVSLASVRLAVREEVKFSRKRERRERAMTSECGLPISSPSDAPRVYIDEYKKFPYLLKKNRDSVTESDISSLSIARLPHSAYLQHKCDKLNNRW